MPKDKNYTEDEHFLSRMYLKEFSEIKKKGNKEKEVKNHPRSYTIHQRILIDSKGTNSKKEKPEKRK